jgi:hypothetical protein
MIEEAASRVRVGDKVRVQYHPPGQVMSFVEGVVSRVDVTTTRGPGFLIDISRDVFLGREQPVKPGYEHYVLYERLEDTPGQVEVLSLAQRETGGHRQLGSDEDAGQQPETQHEAASEPEPKPLTDAEQDPVEMTLCDTHAEAGEPQVEGEHQDGQRRGARIISLFGRRRK